MVPVLVKHDLSKEERQQESILLKSDTDSFLKVSIGEVSRLMDASCMLTTNYIVKFALHSLVYAPLIYQDYIPFCC